MLIFVLHVGAQQLASFHSLTMKHEVFRSFPSTNLNSAVRLWTSESLSYRVSLSYSNWTGNSVVLLIELLLSIFYYLHPAKTHSFNVIIN